MNENDVEQCRLALLGVLNGAASPDQHPAFDQQVQGAGFSIWSGVRPEDVFSKRITPPDVTLSTRLPDRRRTRPRPDCGEELEQKEQTDVRAAKRKSSNQIKDNSAEDKFLAKVSHELRTPLTPIRGVAVAS